MDWTEAERDESANGRFAVSHSIKLGKRTLLQGALQFCSLMWCAQHVRKKDRRGQPLRSCIQRSVQPCAIFFCRNTSETGDYVPRSY